MAKTPLPASPIRGLNTGLIQTPSLPAVGGTSSGNWLSRLSPEAQAALITGGLGAAAGALNARAANQSAQQDRQMTAAQSTANAEQSIRDDRFARDQQGLASTQLDPYAQQRSLTQLAMARAILGGMAPMSIAPGSTQVRNYPNLSGVMDQFLSDDALANAAGNFERARMTLSPFTLPNALGDTGLGAAGDLQMPSVLDARTTAAGDFERSAADQRAALQRAIAGDPTGEAYKTSSASKGGSALKTLGGLGLSVGLGALTQGLGTKLFGGGR